MNTWGDIHRQRIAASLSFVPGRNQVDIRVGPVHKHLSRLASGPDSANTKQNPESYNRSMIIPATV